MNNDTIERAFLLAKKDGNKITEANAEGYFMAALGQEMDLITRLIDTAKGQASVRAISHNMAVRMKDEFQKEEANE